MHRPSDLMRLLVGVLAIVVLLAIAAFRARHDLGARTGQRGTGQAVAR
ncbi:hypothetical protein ACRAWF_45675 [Streptomyces sp. L7]